MGDVLMTKYNFELKYKIVREYIEKKRGYKYLAKKYLIKSEKQIRDWVNNYKKYGEEGLLQSDKNQTYSVEFKLKAIELYLSSDSSYRDVANQLDMKNPSLIANWVGKFRTNGIAGLYSKKGRPSKNTPPTTDELSVDEVNKLKLIEERLNKLDREIKDTKAEKENVKELNRLRRLKQKERFQKLRISNLKSQKNNNDD